MQAAQETPASIRDLSLGALLFCATAAFTLWQNTRVAVLWDLSYLLETAWRISLGQLPYRDFPFAHAPGIFLLHAAIIRIFGRIFWPHIACAALESGAATLLIWRILSRVLRPLGGCAWWIASLLATTLVPLGIYSIYPHPIYDGDCIFALLTALYLFVHAVGSWDWTAGQPRNAVARNTIAGAACVVPLLFKQNIGLAFLAAVLVAVLVIAAFRRMQRQPIASQMWFLVGVFATLTITALVIHLVFGLANYRYWTMAFAAERRLPGLATILGVYHQTSLLWTVPAAIAGALLLRVGRLRDKTFSRVLAFLLLGLPFLWTVAALALTSDPDDRADQLLSLWPHLLVLAAILAVVQIARFVRGRTSATSALLPILVLATIHGTFLSQQLWGSTYALWPLLVLLIAMLLMEVRTIALPLAIAITSTLLLCGSLYAASLERLDYIQLDGPMTRATLPTLRGLATPGPWIPDFETLARFTNADIPAGDKVLAVPGETPFFFATGRTPQFPVLLFDSTTTNPYTPQQTAELVRIHNVRWLIIQRNLQINLPPAFGVAETEAALLPDFALYCQLPGYDIYRRR